MNLSLTQLSTLALLLLSAASPSEAKVHTAKLQKHPMSDTYKDVTFAQYVDSLRNKYIDTFNKHDELVSGNGDANGKQHAFIPFVEPSSTDTDILGHDAPLTNYLNAQYFTEITLDVLQLLVSYTKSTTMISLPPTKLTAQSFLSSMVQVP
ncbi:unnamed protein product [Ambrosiozyma monospora]|uniref:Unnamed protein product n=1 Tax=Ambrosiozyma monospora TaxID=43982 RepID=A0ACB5TAE6_AMBMO|nr:unnamed protein product [Ambrosiozyma monospora]